MYVSALFVGLLALATASPALGKGVVRVKREGSVCSSKPAPSTSLSAAPPASSSSGVAMSSSSTSATDATATSQSGTATTSQSGAPAPTGSGTNSTDHPIPEIEYHGTIYADPSPGGGRRISVSGRYDLCLTVQGGSNAANAAVAIVYCLSDTAVYLDSQLFDFDDLYVGPFEVHANPTLCLDIGEPTNGIFESITLQECSTGGATNFNQSLNWTNDHLIRLTSETGSSAPQSDQCFAVNPNSQPAAETPYPDSLRDLHTAECDAADPYQLFETYSGPDVVP